MNYHKLEYLKVNGNQNMVQNKKSLVVALALVASFLMPARVNATALTQASVRLGRLGISASTNNDVLVTFKLNSTPTSVAKIRVAFPATFTLTTGVATITTGSYPNTPASITVPPGTLTGAASNTTHDIIVSGLTSASLNNTTLYGFYVSSGVVTNPGAAGQYLGSVDSQNGSGTTIDSTPTAMYIYGASPNQDQVTVTASVAPSFSFTLGANADTVPSADVNTVATSPGISLAISTNAPLGYTAYVKSANAALTSAKAGSSIATGVFNGSPDSVVAGSNSYTFVPSTSASCTTACSGSITYDGEYNAIDSAHGGSFNAAGSFASFVSRSGYSGGDTFSLKERVAVSAVQAAANDYTDTLTIVAAGNF